jgi:hypothetical protein
VILKHKLALKESLRKIDEEIELELGSKKKLHTHENSISDAHLVPSSVKSLKKIEVRKSVNQSLNLRNENFFSQKRLLSDWIQKDRKLHLSNLEY